MWARRNRNRYVNKKWANASELKVLCVRASINETWLRVQRPSCSAPFTASFFFCQPGRGDSSGNGFLTQLEGGQRVTWQQPRANQQPQNAQHSWRSVDCLILDNPDSPTALFTTSPSLQSDICGSFLLPSGSAWNNDNRLESQFHLITSLVSAQLTCWHWI